MVYFELIIELIFLPLSFKPSEMPKKLTKNKKNSKIIKDIYK